VRERSRQGVKRSAFSNFFSLLYSSYTFRQKSDPT
jgi:hypothetical protein